MFLSKYYITIAPAGLRIITTMRSTDIKSTIVDEIDLYSDNLVEFSIIFRASTIVTNYRL